ncbi:hypothetical protein BH09MYX1_BH09MYX1_28670 [soil metagenome]
MKRTPDFTAVSIDALTIEDEASFRHVPLYASLKSVLRASRYRFRVLPQAKPPRWDRALFLNLTFWSASGDGDVLTSKRLAADVVAHVAWHHLAAKALAKKPGAALSAEAMFLGESIASAFDLYLVGRLLGHAPASSFLETQVPAIAEATQSAGMSGRAFEKMLRGIADDPAAAFEDLRALLFDTTRALVHATDVRAAARVLRGFDRHRFGALLHHYELSNWVLYARAHAGRALGSDARARAIDRSLREAAVSLDWLAASWVAPAEPKSQRVR